MDIKLGKITEKELVEKYGSPAQKKSYVEKKKLLTKNRQTLLKKMSRYCNIKELGQRMYEIIEIYPYILPANFNKMNSSLYQYIIPLILTTLVNGHDKNRKIDITLGKWAREINMVNKNYTLIKYNKEEASNEFVYPLDTISEFYNKTDDMVEWYIINALDYLKSAGLIIWRDVYRVNVEVSSGKTTIDENGTIYTDVSIDSHQATKEEMKFFSQSINIADKAANINNASERYYSKKSKLFNEVLKRELYKRKIKCVYKTYEAYYIDLDKCQFILKQFNVDDIEKLINDFNKAFRELIVENSGKRFDKAPDKYFIFDSKDDYQLTMRGMCEITINQETEYLGKRIRQKNFEDEYVLKLNKK